MTLKNSIFYYQIIFLLPFSRIINQTTVRSQSHSKMDVRYMKILLSSYFVEIIWTCLRRLNHSKNNCRRLLTFLWNFDFLWFFCDFFQRCMISFLSDSPPLTCLVELYRCENDLDLNRSPGLKQMQCWIVLIKTLLYTFITMIYLPDLGIRSNTIFYFIMIDKVYHFNFLRRFSQMKTRLILYRWTVNWILMVVVP